MLYITLIFKDKIKKIFDSLFEITNKFGNKKMGSILLLGLVSIFRCHKSGL